MPDRMTDATMSRLQHLMALREDAEAVSLAESWNPAHSNGPVRSGAVLSKAEHWAPAADWLDLGSHLLLLLDVPATEPSALELAEDGDELTVAGVRAAWLGAGQVLSSERASGAFSRTLRFPEPVLPNTGEASLEAGVLRVKFAKRWPTIDVSAGDHQDLAATPPKGAGGQP